MSDFVSAMASCRSSSIECVGAISSATNVYALYLREIAVVHLCVVLYVETKSLWELGGVLIFGPTREA